MIRREGKLEAEGRSGARPHAAPAFSPADQRIFLRGLTKALLPVVRAIGVPANLELRRAHCPMAFANTGADWFQKGDEIRNPYYGASMLRCGRVVEVLGICPA